MARGLPQPGPGGGGAALNIGGSLELLGGLPMGRGLLVFEAFGLAAFGVYGLVKAAWRRIGMEGE